MLHERGMVSEDRYEQLAGRYVSEASERQSSLPRLSWSGDFRVRYEGFWFDRDELGVERSNRHRGRYRLRLQGRAQINDWVELVFRVTTGNEATNDSIRSTNETFGGFFNRDGIQFDRAYLRLTPFEFDDASLALEVGKVPNPFRGKIGKGFLLWDGDINPEGAQLFATRALWDGTELYGNAGFYVIEENGGSKDPHMSALQLGVRSALGDHLELGVRGSGFFFDSIDGEFLAHAATFGNLFRNQSPQQVAEFRAYLRGTWIEGLPITLYGTFAENLGVDGLGASNGEDSAWGVGVEVGDKARYATLGFGYFEVEANAFSRLLYRQRSSRQSQQPAGVDSVRSAPNHRTHKSKGRAVSQQRDRGRREFFLIRRCGGALSLAPRSRRQAQLA